MSRLISLLICLLAVANPLRAEPLQSINEVLDNFHDAAARADQTAYLGLLTEDMVFLGTDATERWQGQEFREFVESHFSQGNGWTYRVAQREMAVSRGGNTAWFDELLDNDQLGRCRGSGVLVRTDAGWKLAQYNLSLPVPNELVSGVVAVIRGLEAGGELELEVEHNPDGSLESVELEVELGSDAAADTAAAQTEADQQEAAAEQADSSDSAGQESTDKNCGRRHKTNRKADC